LQETAFTVETSELLQALDSRGHLLLAGSACPDELAKDLGLALLALAQLLTSVSAAETAGAGQPAAATFKAKSNRW
jgi:hypothetical protein